MNADTISFARAVPIEKVIDQRQIKLRGRVERVGPCPVCGGVDRFSVNTKKQVFNCRGCNVGGDVIALVQFLDGISFLEACAVPAGEWVSSGSDKPQRDPRHQQREREQQECSREQKIIADAAERLGKALSLWRRTISFVGTAGELYLREARKYRGPIPATLRFLKSNNGYPPAMVGAFGLADEPGPGILHIAESAITGIHITRLTMDGHKDESNKAKRFLGSSSGSPLVLAPPNDLMGLAITEGIEDAFAAHQATGLGAWAAGSAGRMPTLATVVPDYIEAVTIYAHEDYAGQRGAHELAETLVARGIEVLIESAMP